MRKRRVGKLDKRMGLMLLIRIVLMGISPGLGNFWNVGDILLFRDS